MVQLTLPRNSRIKTGKTWSRPQGKGNWKEFMVCRWNREDGKNPRVDRYSINLAWRHDTRDREKLDGPTNESCVLVARRRPPSLTFFDPPEAYFRPDRRTSEQTALD
jgi:hypothetical protein